MQESIQTIISKAPKRNTKLTKIIADVISFILHPLFMPILMAIVIFYISPERFVGVNKNLQWQMLSIFGLNTVLFPMLATGLMKALNFIPSIKMPEKKDRIMPLMAIMIFYFWMYQVVKNIPTKTTLTAENMYLYNIFFLGNFFGIIGVFIINIFSKISMHTAAAGGALGILIVIAIVGKVNIIIPILIAIALAGIVGTARLMANAHKPIEIWMGYFIGLAAQLLAYWMWR